MRKSRSATLFAALAGVFPFTAHAAVIAITFDFSDIKISPTETGTYVSPSTISGASLSGTAAAPVLSVPAGYFIEYGLDASVKDNNGLGITSFQVGANASNPSIAGIVRPVQHVVINSYFADGFSKGTVDGAGGILTTLGTAGIFLAAVHSTPTVYGAGAPGELFNSMVIAPTSTGTDVFSITANLPGFSYANYVGQSSSGEASYENKFFLPGVDTLSPLPALKINIGVPEPATSALAIAGATGLLIKRRPPVAKI